MKAMCIENNHNNGNFTVNKVYEVKKERISCDFIHVFLDEPIIIQDNQFTFARCKFAIMKNP
jgi:hypothetical protein